MPRKSFLDKLRSTEVVLVRLEQRNRTFSRAKL
jgi:hypothetical protein